MNIVIISGGMCEQEDLLIRPVREFVAANAYPLAVQNGAFRIVKAELGEDAPRIGAAQLYRSLERGPRGQGGKPVRAGSRSSSNPGSSKRRSRRQASPG